MYIFFVPAESQGLKEAGMKRLSNILLQVRRKEWCSSPKHGLDLAWVMALEIYFANLLKKKNNLSSPEVSQHLPDKSQLRTQPWDDLGIFLSD